jgi:hypothetical protein
VVTRLNPTPEARLAKRLKRRRDRQKLRYRNDAEFRRRKIECNILSLARKMEACPEYRTLAGVRRRISHLRNKIDFHLLKLEALEKELLAKVAERDRLAAICRTIKPAAKTRAA